MMASSSQLPQTVQLSFPYVRKPQRSADLWYNRRKPPSWSRYLPTRKLESFLLNYLAAGFKLWFRGPLGYNWLFRSMSCMHQASSGCPSACLCQGFYCLIEMKGHEWAAHAVRASPTPEDTVHLSVQFPWLNVALGDALSLRCHFSGLHTF